MVVAGAGEAVVETAAGVFLVGTGVAVTAGWVAGRAARRRVGRGGGRPPAPPPGAVARGAAAPGDRPVGRARRSGGFWGGGVSADRRPPLVDHPARASSHVARRQWRRARRACGAVSRRADR